MATFTENYQMRDWLLSRINASLQDERRARSDHRVHATEMLYCLRKGWRRRHLPIATSAEGFNAVLLTGHAFDQLAARAEREGDDTYRAHVRVGRPGPAGTPPWSGEADGIIRIDDDAALPDEDALALAVIDFKTTAYGPATVIPVKSPHYVEQVATYLVSEHIRTGVLHTRAFLAIMHLNPRRIVVWDIVFTRAELINWQIELFRREAILTGDVEPGTDECAPADPVGPRSKKIPTSWECTVGDGCIFHVANGGDCLGGAGRARSFFDMERIGAPRMASADAEIRG